MATTRKGRRARAPLLLAAIAAWLAWPAAPAQELTGAELAEALQGGGYVLVLRNGRAAAEPPAEGDASPANVERERELDRHGQGRLSALSYAFRELGIPVGQTFSSPAYRSRQSAHYLGFGERSAVEALAEPAAGGDASWLEQRVAEAPASGRNTVIVTHASLIAEALGHDLDTAETLIYRPAEGGAELVARLTVEDWSKMAFN